MRAALHGAGGLFTFARAGSGSPPTCSEVYALLEALPGVIGVRVDAFFSRATVVLADVVPAGVDEWLRLDAERPRP